MKGILSRLKRPAAILGVGALMVGGVMLGATQAHAATRLGSQLTLTLTPAGTAASPASTTGAVGYSAPACPSPFNGDAIFKLVDPGTGATTNIAATNTSAGSAMTGSLFNNELNTVATAVYPDVIGQSAEIVVQCTSADLTQSEYLQDNYVFFVSATQYYVTNTAPVQTTNVTVTLTPNPTTGTVGQPVQLTAQTSVPTATGSIQFEDTSTATPTILATVPLNGTTGTAISSFTPSAANATGEPLKAVYLPGTGFAFSDTASDAILLVVNAAAPNSGAIPLAVVVPATGVFVVTIDTKDWVQLVVSDPTNPILATANTTNINVEDTRNNFPGWSVSGQSTQFSGTIPPASSSLNAFPTFTNPATVPADHGSQTIAANQLGWTPNPLPATPVVPGLSVGGTVAPVTTGLGTAAVLASVHAGTGNGFTGTAGVNLTAALTLDIPVNQEAGPYAGDLNITSVSALP